MKPYEKKRCSRCMAYRFVADFRKRNSSRDTLRGHCKKCLNEYSRENYFSNHAQRLAQRKVYREGHLEERRAIRVAYKELGRASNQRRKARKRGATTGEIFTDLQIFKSDKWICSLCHGKVNWRLKFPNPMSKSLGHIIPLIPDNPYATPGTHSWQNCTLAHLRCNVSEGNRVVTQQMRLF